MNGKFQTQYRSIVWLLSVLVLLSTAIKVKCQPTFQECKIYLLASDTERDLSLDREEYIRYVNLVSRTYHWKQFRDFVSLPSELKQSFNEYASNETSQIDISAAQFNAIPTEDEINNLQSLCDETSEIIGKLLQAPTAPSPSTPLPATLIPTTQAPVTNKPSAQGRISQNATERPTRGPDDSPRNVQVGRDGQSPTSATNGSTLAQLPAQCRRGMFGSDANKDGFLSETEYTTFVNRLSTTAFNHVATYAELPAVLRLNFDNLTTTDQLNIYGAIPSEWPDTTADQRAFLEKLCTRTEAAVAAAANEPDVPPAVSPPTAAPPTATPPTAGPPTAAPTSSLRTGFPTNVPTSQSDNGNVYPGQTNTDANDSSGGSNTVQVSHAAQDSLGRNGIAAIVGSILIVFLGAYIARGKRDSLRPLMERFRSKFGGNNENGFPHNNPSSNKNESSERTGLSGASSANENSYDLEALDTQQTTFLEDSRVGGGSCMDEDVEELDEVGCPVKSPSSFQTEDFETFDFDTGRFIVAPSEDDEGFTQYRFDDNHSVMSSSMSLYCNSVMGEQNKASNTDLLSSFKPGARGQKKDRGSTSTAATARLSEYSDRYGYSPTELPWNRFDRIDQWEADYSNNYKSNIENQTLQSTVPLETDGGHLRNSSLFLEGEHKNVQEAHKKSVDNNEKRSQRNPDTKTFSGLEHGPSCDCNESDDEVPEVWSDEPSFLVMDNPKPRRPFRFVSYSNDEHDSLTSERIKLEKGMKYPRCTKQEKKAVSGANRNTDNAASKQRKRNKKKAKDEEGVSEVGKILTNTKSRSSCQTSPRRRRDQTGNRMSLLVGEKREVKRLFGDFTWPMDTSVGSSFVRFSDSEEESIKSEFFSTSDKESLHEGLESESSTLQPCGSPASGKEEAGSVVDSLMYECSTNPEAMIRELVAKVMPTEKGRVEQMLEQYRGREMELVNTLSRLDVQLSTQRCSRKNSKAESKNTGPKHASKVGLDKEEVLTLSAVASCSAEMMAAASAVIPQVDQSDAEKPSDDSMAWGSAFEKVDMGASCLSADFTSGDDSTYYGEASTISDFSILR